LLNKDTRDEIVRLLQSDENYSTLDVARLLNVPRTTVSAVLANLNRKSKSQVTSETRTSKGNKKSRSEATQEMLRTIDLLKRQMSLIGTPSTAKPHRKILCMSDFHVPFENEDFIKKAISDHSDADILVINGDLFDGYAVSKFVKDKEIALLYEYRKVLGYIEKFAGIFPKVVLTKGNHEERINTYMNTHLTQNLSWLFDYEILNHIAKGEVYDDDGRKIAEHNFKNVITVGSEEKWWVRIGKTIFCHPKFYSKVYGRTGEWAHNYFRDQLIEFDCIVVAHNHHQAKLAIGGRTVIEQGSMCHTLDYARTGKPRYAPMDLGYAVIYQDRKGNTIQNISGYYHCGISLKNQDIIDNTM